MRYIVYLSGAFLAILFIVIVSDFMSRVDVVIIPATQTSAVDSTMMPLGNVINPTLTQNSKPIAKRKSNSIDIDTLLSIAKRYIGTPYKMGGTSYEGMDCSGLLVAIFKEMGYKLPHNSAELAKNGILISKIEQLTEGDLLFFHTEWENKGLINHTGLYIGKGYFIHASTSQGTIISKINSPSYRNSFICASRILLPQQCNNLMSRNRMVVVKTH